MAQDLKDTIKEKIDLLDFLTTKGITWQNQGSIPKALCVFHEEKTPSFTLSKDRKRYKCYGCNESGDVFDYLMSAEKLTFVEALRQLSAYLSLDYDDNTFSDQLEKRKKANIISSEVIEVNSLAQNYFSKQIFDESSENSKNVRHYLEQRGITSESIKQNFIGYCPDGNMGSLMNFFQSNKVNKRGVLNSNLLLKTDDNDWIDFFRNRVTVAILDENSNIVGFSGRSLHENSKSKYINSRDSEVFNKSNILYGLDRASENIKLKSQAVVVEGYFDCISGYDKGYQNLVAAMGTQISAENFEKLKKLVTYDSSSGEIIFCFDNDSAGKKAAIDTIDKLKENISSGSKNSEKKIRIKICFPTSGKDPDEIFRTNPVEWEEMINLAQNFIDYLINYYSEIYLKGPQKDTYKFLDLILPFIIESCDETQQSFYLSKISKVTDLSYDLLKSESSNLSKSKYRKNIKTIKDEDRIRRVIFNPEKAQEKHFLAILIDSNELFENVKDVEDVYFSDLHYRSVFKLWKKSQEVIDRKTLSEDLIFIYDEIEDYLKNDFVVDPDLSKDIELENVKNRLAIDFQKRRLNETEIRLLELENNEQKDENAITSIMDELVKITENIKELERSEVT
ncbi:MAG: DNA primase [Chloroflexi bacterium]|jgi:DNA primase|nr:DNA primase [Chloroflexota bacterium]|tara:strand:+ start:8008 stop:9870 length:1863 start_codon:yes stop_codon:yes gene_type:complete